MMNAAVESCMDIENGNILDAIGIAEQLVSFTNVSFGDTTSLDIAGLDFSDMVTMLNEVSLFYSPLHFVRILLTI